MQLSDRPVGDYYLHVWASPSIPRVGDIHVESLVLDKNGQAISECQVIVSVTPQDESRESMVIPAGEAKENTQFRHEADFVLSQPGDYQVNVSVFDGSVSLGDATFDLRITTVSTWVKTVVNLMMLALVLVGVWFMAQGLRLVQLRVVPEY
ncbi:hypothetical protein KFU94_40245 [Chloroflexi bacterium TSY]|nr:hypothetical protein [Chloroflexi bacterium TSY]